MYFLIEHRNEITMQVSYDSLDSKLLKPTRNHGPTPGPQKGVKTNCCSFQRSGLWASCYISFVYVGIFLWIQLDFLRLFKIQPFTPTLKQLQSYCPFCTVCLLLLLLQNYQMQRLDIFTNVFITLRGSSNLFILKGLELQVPFQQLLSFGVSNIQQRTNYFEAIIKVTSEDLLRRRRPCSIKLAYMSKFKVINEFLY